MVKRRGFMTTPKYLPKGIKNKHPHTVRIFTAALFTTAERWKQPKCPSADE